MAIHQANALSDWPMRYQTAQILVRRCMFPFGKDGKAALDGCESFLLGEKTGGR